MVANKNAQLIYFEIASVMKIAILSNAIGIKIAANAMINVLNRLCSLKDVMMHVENQRNAILKISSVDNVQAVVSIGC